MTARWNMFCKKADEPEKGGLPFMNSIYDDPVFFDAYAQMSRSKDGLKSAGEWHQLQPLFPLYSGFGFGF